MSKARELLKRFMHELTKEELCSVPDELQAEIEELLDQPEEGVYQKLLRIEDGVEVEILPSELWQDGYEAGKRSVLLSKQPEQHGTQYLLDQVARLTAENAMLKEKWSTSKQPEQEPVAWMLIDKETGARIPKAYKPEHGVNKDRWELYPLHTTLPKREPLSDEAICDILIKKEWKGFVELVRIIEKAHGIGGGE